jgi:ankyrin repeat protein
MNRLLKMGFGSVIVLLIIFISVTKYESMHRREGAKLYFGKGPEADLVYEALMGDSTKMDQLLASGVNINCRGKYGMSPVNFAVWAYDKRATQLLLEKGADPNQQDDEGKSAMSEAAGHEREAEALGHEESWYLKTVMKYGGKVNLVNKTDGTTPIFDAILACNLTNVKILVEAGANLNQQDAGGNTPIIAAAIQVQYDIVYYLLQVGADPKINNNTLTYYIQHSYMDNASPSANDREKVIDWLKQRNLWNKEATNAGEMPTHR